MLRYFFYLLILALPSYIFKLHLPGGGSFNGLDLLELIFCLLFLAFLIKNKNFLLFKSFLKENIILLLSGFLLLLSLGLSFLNNVTNTNWLSGLGLFKSYFFLPISTSLAAKFLFEQKILSFKKLFLVYLAYSSLLSLGAISYLLSGQFTYDGRLAFFFNSPNYLAIALAPGILIALFFLKEPSLLGSKKIYWSILVLQLIPFLFTKSFGSLLALLFATFFLLSTTLRLGKNFFKGYLLISALLLALFFNLPAILSWANYTPAIPASSTDSRLAIYQSATRIIQDHWLLGIGLGNFQDYYLAYQKYFMPYPQWAVPHAHNLALHFWLESGLLGLISFFFLVYWGLKNKKGPFSILAKALLIYFLLHGLVDTPFWKNDLALFFWLLLFL